MRFDDPVRLRRMILWIMLGALAASAALAIGGVLDNSFEQSTRMIGSGIAAVVASGLLLLAGKLPDSDANRKTGLFIMGLIVVQFVLVLPALWDPLRVTGQFQSEEMFGETAAMFVLVAIPAGLFFYVRQQRGGRLAGLFGLAPTAIASLFFLAGIWSAAMRGNPMDDYFWETGWGLWFFAFAAPATVGGAGTDRRHWRWIGLAAAVSALTIGLYQVWTRSDEKTLTNLLTILITLSILIGHANVIWLCKLKPGQHWLRWVAVACACFSGGIFDWAIIGRSPTDIFWRIATAAGICAGCGTVAVAILAAFNRRTMPVGGDEIDAAEIVVVCPVCRKKRKVALSNGFGQEPCPGCGTIVSVRVRAPRCANCNYILLMFHGDRCPECGAAVTPARGGAIEA